MQKTNQLLNPLLFPFLVKCVVIDYILQTPLPQFDPTTIPNRSNRRIHQIPLLRVFGSTPIGQKICLYIHGYFPFFYVPLPNEAYGREDEFLEEFQHFIEDVWHQIEEHKFGVKQTTLQNNTSNFNIPSSSQLNYNHVMENNKMKSTDKTTHHPLIYKLNVVDKINFYGYHMKSKFIKIYTLDPMKMKDLAVVLQSAETVGYPLQPFEIHIPYTLHFMSDNNINGMDFIYLKNIKLRTPLPECMQLCSLSHPVWRDIHYNCCDDPYFGFNEEVAHYIKMVSTPIITRSLLKESEGSHSIQKWTTSELEGDAMIDDIVEKMEYMRGRQAAEVELHEEAEGCVGDLLPSAMLVSSLSTLWKDIERINKTKCSDLKVEIVRNGGVDRVVMESLTQKYMQQKLMDCINSWLSNVTESAAISDGVRKEVHQSDDKINIEGRRGGSSDTISEATNTGVSGVRALDRRDDTRNESTELNDSNMNSTNQMNDVDVHPFFGDPRDVPPHSYSSYIKHQMMCKPNSFNYNISFTKWFKYFKLPPNVDELSKKIKSSTDCMRLSNDVSSTISGPTVLSQKFLLSTIDCSYLECTPDYCTLMTVEVLTECTKLNGGPDASRDSLLCIVYRVRDQRVRIRLQQTMRVEETVGRQSTHDVSGALFVSTSIDEFVDVDSSVDIKVFERECDCLHAFCDVLMLFDPTIIVGYDTDDESVGYIYKRAHHLGMMDVCAAFSRVLKQQDWRLVSMNDRRWNRRQPPFKLEGRLIFCLWRLMRDQVKCKSYRFEYLVKHLTGITLPSYSMYTLSKWWTTVRGGIVYTATYPLRWMAVKYLLQKVKMNLKVIDTSQLLERSGELARLYGMDLWSVLTRGSQFRVESLLIRSAHKLGYLLLSPTRKQVGEQAAQLCIPMVMEPLSSFYWSPVVVLDFQSLYPSIIIAYNICYSTCIGSLLTVNEEMTTKECAVPLGVTDVTLSPSLIAKISELYKQNDEIDCISDVYKHGISDPPFDESFHGISILPNETMFASKYVRCGVLPQMLNEILQTRIMVKKLMNNNNVFFEENEKFTLNHRQLGLKMIANFAYGYTSASFSGRMPCAEIADAIVQTARQTLEDAIKTVEMNQTWGAKVVYGDTDSMFVYLEGRSLEESFRIGREIAAVITQRNPYPVELKMEKVYCPGCLISKKRYVGNAYKSPSSAPYFDSKGIETMRSDQCDLTATVMSCALKLLFKTKNLSILKSYLQRQWKKILNDKSIINDFIIYNQNKLALNNTRILVVSERPKNALLSEATVSPDNTNIGWKPLLPLPHMQSSNTLLSHHQMYIQLKQLETDIQQQWEAHLPYRRVDYRYYIEKQIIPPIERLCKLLEFVSIPSWFNWMPKLSNELLEGMADYRLLDSRLWRDGEVYKSSIVEEGASHQPIDLYSNSFHSKTSTPVKLNLTFYYKSSRCVICKLLIKRNAMQHSTENKLRFELRTSLYGEVIGDCVDDTVRDIEEIVESNSERRHTNVDTSNRGESPFVCQLCASKPSYVLVQLNKKLNKCDKRLEKLYSLCMHCTGSTIGGMACHNAWHCQVYGLKIRESQRQKEALFYYRSYLQ